MRERDGIKFDFMETYEMLNKFAGFFGSYDEVHPKSYDPFLIFLDNNSNMTA